MINIDEIIEKENTEIMIEQKMKIKYINEDIHEMERKQRVYSDFGDLTGYRGVTKELNVRRRDLAIAEIIYYAAAKEEVI